MISTQILIYTIYNTLCDSNSAVHNFIRTVLHSLNGAHVISTFSVRIKTAAIFFKCILTSNLDCVSNVIINMIFVLVKNERHLIMIIIQFFNDYLYYHPC